MTTRTDARLIKSVYARKPDEAGANGAALLCMMARALSIARRCEGKISSSL